MPTSIFGSKDNTFKFDFSLFCCQRLKKRAAKFGLMSEDARKKARAERFELFTPSSHTIDIFNLVFDKLKCIFTNNEKTIKKIVWQLGQIVELKEC